MYISNPKVATKYNKKIFRMAYSEETFKDNDGWCKSTWHEFAEQLMMYLIYAGQPGSDPKLAQDLYFGFSRKVGSYKINRMYICFR